MYFLNKFNLNLKWSFKDIREKIRINRLKRKYPDYENNEFNCGSVKFIWGLKSYDDLTANEANIYTMNDIEITYDRDFELYYLGVETEYSFENKNDECQYLRSLLSAFDQFMDKNNFSKFHPYSLPGDNLRLSYSARFIPELYTHFRIFVEGFCAVNTEQTDTKRTDLSTGS